MSEEGSRSFAKIKLGWLVTAGTVFTTVFGLAAFYVFVWLQVDRPWSWTGEFLGYATGDQLFDSARTAVTFIGIVGIGGAALIAFRRQLAAEMSHMVESEKFDLERERHRIDRQLALHTRFSGAAELLGSPRFVMRVAGVHSLAALADEWNANSDADQMQNCIEVLCAYLRVSPAAGQDSEETQVRSAILRSIRLHTSRGIEDNDVKSWKLRNFNLNGAHLEGADLSDTLMYELQLIGAVLDNANLARSDLTAANLAGAQLHGALLHGASLSSSNLRRTNLSGAFVDGDTNFNEAFYTRDTLWPIGFQPPPSRTNE